MREFFKAGMLNPSLKSRFVTFVHEFSRFNRIKNFATRNKKGTTVKKRVYLKK